MTEQLPAPKGKKRMEIEQARETLQNALDGGGVPRSEIGEALRHFPEVAADSGDLAALAEASLMRLVANGSVVLEELLQVGLEAERGRLALPGDGELERIMVHQVVIASLALSIAERTRVSKWQGGMTAADADFWDRHVSRLQIDLLRACRALATVRSLRRPTLVAQVNIAEQQQINIGQSGSTR